MSSIPDYEGNNFLINERHEDLLERRIILKNLSRGKFAIDLGGGYGRLTNLLLDNYDHVFLMDYSLKNLRIAREKLNANNVTYIACDIREPPIIDDIFDFGMCIRVFHHYPKLDFLPSIIRKIRLNGNFIFNFNNLESPILLFSLARHIFSDRRNTINPLKKITQKIDVECGSRNIYFTTLRDVLSNIYEEAEVTEISGAGLFHNEIFESLSPRLNVSRIVQVEMIIGKIEVFARLFPDLFITLKKNRESSPHILKPDSIILCKRCWTPLYRHDDSMQCSNCSARYPIIDGIIDLR